MDKIVKAEATKLLDEAIVNDKKVSGWFWELLQRIEATINSVEVLTLRFAINIRDLPYNCYNLGKLVAESGDQAAVANNAFQALDKFGKAKYVASIGLSSISLVLNAKTLGETLAKVRKGEVLKVVSDIRDQAQKLEDEVPVYKKKVELLKQRVYEKELELERRAKEKELELLKRRAASQRSFYMAFFVCCIGIIIYFLCYRL